MQRQILCLLLLGALMLGCPVYAGGAPLGPSNSRSDPFDKCLIDDDGSRDGGLIRLAEVKKLEVGEKLTKTVELGNGLACDLVFEKTAEHLGVLRIGNLEITIYDTKEGPDNVYFAGGLLTVSLSPVKTDGYHPILLHGGVVRRLADRSESGTVMGWVRYDEPSKSFKALMPHEGDIPVVRHGREE